MFSKESKISIAAEVSEADELNFLSSLPGSSYDWPAHETEGQLAVDVAQTSDELIVVATMAGTAPDRIGLHLHNDLLTIRGERVSPMPDEAEHFHQETYWGKFSRTIVLPADVRCELVQAQYKNGILTIRLPKRNAEEKIPILVIEE